MRDSAVSTCCCKVGVGEGDGVDILQHELLQPGIGHHADPRAGLRPTPPGAAHRFRVDMHAAGR